MMITHIRRSFVPALLAMAIVAGPAASETTLKIAYIDPLSGGAASAGILGQKHFNYFADKINAAGGVNGQTIEIVAFGNKVSPQESFIILKKVIADGTRYLNYAAVDPALTNEKCNFWHFRFDADANMKMEALSNYIAQQKGIKKVYLINQDYSFGKAVAVAARAMLAAA